MPPDVPEKQPSAWRWVILAGLGFVSWISLAAILQAGVGPSPAEQYMSKKEVGKAEAEFEKIVRNAPNNPESYLFVMFVCEKEGRLDLASKYLERALHACKDAPKPERALLYEQQTKILSVTEPKPQPQTLAAAQRAAALDPNSPNLLNTYGYLLADSLPQGDPRLNEAVTALSRALVLLKPDENPLNRFLNPKSELEKELLAPQAEDSYGWALYKQGKFDLAYNALSEAISDSPKLIQSNKVAEASTMKVLYYHLGAAALKSGKKEEARRALNTSLGYDKNYLEAREAMAELDKK